MSEIQIAGIVSESIVDGPGIRYVIFTQGCPHKCVGCHNPESHDYHGGFTMTDEKILTEIKKNPLLDGVTFSGGEPFEQAQGLSYLAEQIKSLSLNVICYTGYTFEAILEKSQYSSDWANLLSKIDILIDGKFDLSQKDLLLRFRGSKNQRVIDVPKTLQQGTISLVNW